jgi:hypothetical protein
LLTVPHCSAALLPVKVQPVAPELAPASAAPPDQFTFQANKQFRTDAPVDAVLLPIPNAAFPTN